MNFQIGADQMQLAPRRFKQQHKARPVIGCEVNAEYVTLAQGRLKNLAEQETKQPELWVAANSNGFVQDSFL